MKIFVDTANLEEIAMALRSGVVEGITTNPSLLAKEPKGKYLEHMARVVELAKPGNFSVSIEVFSNDPDEMVRQALEFDHSLGYGNLAIKVPISYAGQNNLGVVKKLAERDIAVNCTACMTPMQAAMAAKAGAKYVSIFYNRLRDPVAKKEEAGRYKEEIERRLGAGDIEKSDFDPDQVIRETREMIVDCPDAEIIAGSIRTVVDVKHAFLAGAHIVTASWNIMNSAVMHFKTDHAVKHFLDDFSTWIS